MSAHNKNRRRQPSPEWRNPVMHPQGLRPDLEVRLKALWHQVAGIDHCRSYEEFEFLFAHNITPECEIETYEHLVKVLNDYCRGHPEANRKTCYLILIGHSMGGQYRDQQVTERVEAVLKHPLAPELRRRFGKPRPPRLYPFSVIKDGREGIAALQEAEVILGKDLRFWPNHQTCLYGRDLLEEIRRSGQTRKPKTVTLVYDSSIIPTGTGEPQPLELEYALALVQVAKGRHDYGPGEPLSPTATK